ncbi:MAG: diaminopimelate epimerase [Nitriliruptor sp.]|uniref:diaminopimelate epimerase n=1 Tax=Nitriliruptor sp. TaxID=2448056 RepID=UPI0034A0908D
MDVIKAHGTGNDFVVLLDVDDRLEVPVALVRALTDRRLGVGGDGVIRLGAPPVDQPDADVFMDYRNADGTTAEMCGNGVRVTAKLAVDHGLVTPHDGEVVRVATRAGTKPVVVHLGVDGRVEQVSVDMGPPILTPADVPFTTDRPDLLVHDLDVDGTVLPVSVVSMGNPHAVTLVDDVSTAPVTTIGPLVEVHPRFPAKVNVGFAEVVDRSTIRLRVWERGVGETAACGTGACAAVVALQRLDRVDDRVEVHLPGGVLEITHTDGGTVTMRGPATEVATVHLTDDWLAAADGTPVAAASA